MAGTHGNTVRLKLPGLEIYEIGWFNAQKHTNSGLGGRRMTPHVNDEHGLFLWEDEVLLERAIRHYIEANNTDALQHLLDFRPCQGRSSTPATNQSWQSLLVTAGHLPVPSLRPSCTLGNRGIAYTPSRSTVVRCGALGGGNTTYALRSVACRV